MKKYNSRNLRQLYFDFFIEKNHKLIPSASLIPENDPTVLFTTAGMHPLVPYLLGEHHPSGNRLVNVQKCIRTNDIDEVGDTTHLTFFEMLGNWSLGDYFKKESLEYSYEFLNSPKWLDIPKDKLYFTCFEGDEFIPKDEESYNALINIGIDPSHIFFLGKEDNFWILGSGIGPCGPDCEIFYDTGLEKCSDKCIPSCNCGKYVEIWNNVFMEYHSHEDKSLTKLKQQNVDTGMGLERTLAVLNNEESPYETDLFLNLKNKIVELSNKDYDSNIKEMRIIMDHIRSSVFILGDDLKIVPSNIERGYVLRRLIRRTIRSLIKLELNYDALNVLALVVINDYKDIYEELDRNKEFILAELEKEGKKFSNTLRSGERLFYKTIRRLEGNVLSGEDAFKLFDTFGFPLEMTIELASENNLTVDVEGFHQKFKEHQEKSKTLEKGQIKGGLADESYETVKYHTAAHILLETLKQVFGEQVEQRGSNISAERLRFDFNLDFKMSDEEKQLVENKVNEVIKRNLDVTVSEMTLEEAKDMGAHGTFDNKYGNLVKVYQVGNYSKEICGGPHVKNTNELGTFKIIKEESISAGTRRIRAKLES